jgi:hypothetical protein
MSTRLEQRRDRDLRRSAVLGGLVVALVGLGVVSVSVTGARAPVAPASVAAVNLGAESSAFYCGGLEHIQGVLESYVAIADLASTPRIVEITTTNDQQQVSLRQVKVRPGRVFHFTPAKLISGSIEAVSIDANQGGIAATESIRGTNGVAVAPCLSAAASSWWLVGGSTEPGSSFVLSVFNPYASQAVVSVTLVTPTGIVVPNSFQGLLLGPHQLAALSVHGVAPNQSPITAHVVATDGSVVAYGIERSTRGASVLSLLPGSPSTSSRWYFPLGSGSPDVTTQLLLLDAGPRPATATVQVVRPPGCAGHCSAPFVVDLAPGVTSTLTVSPSTRVLPGLPIAVSVVATSPGVVVAQRVSAAGATGQNTPLDDPSLTGAGRLVLVNPLANGFDAVVVMNPSATAVRVTLETVSPSGQKAIGVSYGVEANGMIVLGAKALRGVIDGVLELVATGPIVASGAVHGALGGSSVLVAAPT